MRKKQGYKTRKEPSEFDQKIIDISRVVRVVKGGRRFSFRVSIVIGNKKGEVGVGVGKAADTAMGIEKAVKNAKKKRIKIALTKEGSIAHEVEAKFTQARIALRPARKGRGLVVGSSVRTVLDLAGVKDISAKVLSRSKNKLNIARATISALQKLKSEARSTKSEIISKSK